MGIWNGKKEFGAWELHTVRDVETQAIPLPTPEELESLIKTHETPTMSQEPSSQAGSDEPHSAN